MREYLKRQDELYYRLTPIQLMNLFAEYEVDGYEEVSENRGGWDGPRVVTVEAEEKPDYERPYIIFDLRSREEFNQCHILQARNHPAILLNQDKMTAEMFNYKNKEGQLIILYDNDTTVACQAAHTMVIRGFDNTYILSGGLYAFSERYPQYIEGTAPIRPNSTSSKSGRPPASGRANSEPPSRSGSASRTASGRRLLSAAGSQIAGGGAKSVSGESHFSQSKVGSARRDSDSKTSGRLTAGSLSSHGKSFKGNGERDVQSMNSKMTDRSVAETIISQSAARKGKR